MTDSKQLELFDDVEYEGGLSPKYWDVPFVDEVQEFNEMMGKPNRYEPTIGTPNDWKFVYDFILEELEEYKEACEKGDIVGILDALCDITYVSLGNGTLLHGLKGQIYKAYQEVQASNMSKSCATEAEAQETVTDAEAKVVKEFEGYSLDYQVKSVKESKIIKILE